MTRDEAISRTHEPRKSGMPIAKIAKQLFEEGFTSRVGKPIADSQVYAFLGNKNPDSKRAMMPAVKVAYERVPPAAKKEMPAMVIIGTPEQLREIMQGVLS